jgi:MFS family permease
MCFALFMVMLDNTVVNIALPAIKDSFGASISGLSWTVNAYTLVFGVLLVSGGRLGDVFGRKRMFLAGLIVFTLGSIGAGLSGSIGELVFFRGVQGVGAAFLMPGSLSIITNTFSGPSSGARSACGPASPASRWAWARSWAACWSRRPAGSGSSSSTCPWRSSRCR